MLLPPSKMMAATDDPEVQTAPTSAEIRPSTNETEQEAPAPPDQGPDSQRQEKNGETEEQEQPAATNNGSSTSEPCDRGSVQSPVPILRSTLDTVTSDLANTRLGKACTGDNGDKPAKFELKYIPIGEPGVKSKLKFDVVTARVIETAGKKHVVCWLVWSWIMFQPIHPLFFFQELLHHDQEAEQH